MDDQAKVVDQTQKMYLVGLLDYRLCWIVIVNKRLVTENMNLFQ